jgi:hypothetical protein
MKEQALSPAEPCPALSVDSKPLGVLDIRDTLEVLFRAGKMSGSCYSTPSTALPTAVSATSAAGPRGVGTRRRTRNWLAPCATCITAKLTADWRLRLRLYRSNVMRKVPAA